MGMSVMLTHIIGRSLPCRLAAKSLASQGPLSALAAILQSQESSSVNTLLHSSTSSYISMRSNPCCFSQKHQPRHEIMLMSGQPNAIARTHRPEVSTAPPFHPTHAAVFLSAPCSHPKASQSWRQISFLTPPAQSSRVSPPGSHPW